MKRDSDLQMAAIGVSDGQTCASSIASIVFNYGRTALVILRCLFQRWLDRSAVSGFQARKAWQNQPIGTAIRKSLLDLNIARPGMHVQQRAAIPNFSLDMVAGHGALCSERMIHLQRS